MDFNWQPVSSLEELRNEFGAVLLKQGAALAEYVVFDEPGIGEYNAAVENHRVAYDGWELPGSCRCTCGGTFMSAYCPHLAAVALVVLGRGTVPSAFASELEAIEFDHGTEIDSLDEDSMREMLHSLIGNSVLARDMVADRAALEKQLADDGRDPAEARDALAAAVGELRRVKAEPAALKSAVATFTHLASTYLAAGFGRSLGDILLNAISVMQEKTRAAVKKMPRGTDDWSRMMQDGKREDVERLGDAIVDLLVEARPPRNQALFNRVIRILEKERADEETILMRPLKALLGPEFLPALLDWCAARGENSIKTWGRQLNLAGELGQAERYRDLIRVAPPGTQRVVAQVILAEETTAENLGVVERFLADGVLSYTTYGTTNVYAVKVAEWLATTGADSPAAGDLLRRIAVECFDESEFHDSMRVFVLAFGTGAESRAQALELGLANPHRPGARMFGGPEVHESLRRAIIESHYLEADADVELIDVDDAWKSDLDSVRAAMQHMQEDFPATAVNLGIRIVVGLADAGEYWPTIVTAIKDLAETTAACDREYRLWRTLADLRRTPTLPEEFWRELTAYNLWPHVLDVDPDPNDDGIAGVTDGS